MLLCASSNRSVTELTSKEQQTLLTLCQKLRAPTVARAGSMCKPKESMAQDEKKSCHKMEHL